MVIYTLVYDLFVYIHMISDQASGSSVVPSYRGGPSLISLSATWNACPCTCLGMRIKQRCIQEQLVSPQQHVHMVSSAGGERMIPGEIGFVWSRVAGPSQAAQTTRKENTFCKGLAFENFFCHAALGAAVLSAQHGHRARRSLPRAFSKGSGGRTFYVHVRRRAAAGRIRSSLRHKICL